MNPLLDFSGLPRFAEIKPEHVAPGHRPAARRGARGDDARRARRPRPGMHFVAPLEDANERLARAWGQVGHLHAVLDSPPLREAYNANLPKITQYWTELGQNQRLFEKYKRSRPRPDSRACRPRAGKSWRTRCAISAWAARSCPTRAEAALCRDPGGTGLAVGEILRERARCDQRLVARDRGREAPRRHSRRRRCRRRAKACRMKPGRTARPAGSSPCRCLPTCR